MPMTITCVTSCISPKEQVGRRGSPRDAACRTSLGQLRLVAKPSPPVAIAFSNGHARGSSSGGSSLHTLPLLATCAAFRESRLTITPRCKVLPETRGTAGAPQVAPPALTSKSQDISGHIRKTNGWNRSHHNSLQASFSRHSYDQCAQLSTVGLLRSCQDEQLQEAARLIQVNTAPGACEQVQCRR